MTKREWWRLATLALWSCTQLVAGCDDDDDGDSGSTPVIPSDRVCLDDDGDGYGFQCDAGPDCDDTKASIHQGCAACSVPAAGCACAADSEPVTCIIDPKLNGSGDLLCKEGTRYCRDQKWSECEGIASFSAPTTSSARNVKLQGLVGNDAGVKCSDCNPDCYQVSDPLGSYDAGADSAITSQNGGGITLAGGGGDAAVVADAGLLDDYSCVPGTAPDTDCDGIPDSYDQNSGAPPFETDHKTIFMGLDPGQSGSQDFRVSFNLASADVYFYLDMTGSMEPERDKLISSLINGNYLPAAVASQNCADRDGDGTPDNYLKDLGVAGNIACLIKDARFGAGWFRDLPWSAHGDNDFEMYENRLDITADVGALQTALGTFGTRGGNDYPENSMQGLYALATGNEVYAGWDRPGIPSRAATCPSGTFGAACWRNGAVPIVIHVTDDGMNYGPPTTSGGSTYPFPSSTTTFSGMKLAQADSGGRYLRPLTTSAETYGTAQDFGTVDDKFITYAGSTEKMATDLTFLQTGSCPSGSAWSTSDQTGKDAVFKFTVGTKLTGTTNRTIKLSASGSRFDSSLLLFSGTPPTITTYTAANNGTFASAYDLGTISPGRVVVSGDSTLNGSYYSRESLTTTSGCFVGTSANDTAPASVVKFRLAADASLKFYTNSSAQETALFTGSALESTNYNLSTLDCGSGAYSNCNDKVGQFSLGDIVGGHFHLSGGDTSDSHVVGDYSAEFASCSKTYNTASDDTVVDFTVSATSNVRIETSGQGSNMQASFPHGISVVRKPSGAASTTKTVANGNSDQATAYTIVEADLPAAGTFISYRGDSATDTPTYQQSEVGGSSSGICHNGNAGGATALKDVVFKFTPSATGKYDFDTAPASTSTGYKTWLSLHNSAIATSTTTAVSNLAELDTGAGQAVGVTPTIDSRQVILTGGQIDQRNVSFAPSIMGNYCGSTSNSPSSMGGRDAVFKFRATSNGSVAISVVNSSGAAGSSPAFDSFFAVYKNSIAGGNIVSANCNPPPLLGIFGSPSNPSGNGYSATINTTAGTDYYILVKEWTYDTSMNATKGQFGLIIQDSRFSTSFVSCDAASSPSSSNFSRLTATLTGGTTYYLVLKGTGAGANTNYALNVRKSGATGTTGTVVACADSSSNRATLSLSSLTAGEYSLIIKGQTTTGCFGFCTTQEKGTYDVTIRDLAVAPVPVACSNGSSTNFTASSLKQKDASNNVIDYYLVTRGNTAGAPYQLMIENTSAAAIASANACADGGGQGANAEISKALAPGTYYAVLKGHDSDDYGMFQMSIGEDKSGVTTSGNFTPKTYKDDVKSALTTAGVRVITVDALSTTNMARPCVLGTCTPSNAYKQSLVLAQDTGAPVVSSTQTYEITTAGVGMGSAVVTAVSDLANNLSMNLGVILTTIAPNVPSKPFGFLVQTLPNPGNCQSAIDTDSNGITDTWTTCRPGANPGFKITITNPAAPNNVPASTLDPNGGYQMKLQLIGNGKFVMDEIPVYIIPSAVNTGTQPKYASTGSYEQVVSAKCSGTDAPNWRALAWTDSLPAGTSVVWQMCSANKVSDLSSCTLRTAGTVTSGAACTSNAQCTNGYCASSGVCEYVVGPACSANADCGTGGACVNNACAWTQNPIDLLPTLTAGMQGNTNMRVRATLNANADGSKAPSISDWKLQYYCAPGL